MRLRFESTIGRDDKNPQLASRFEVWMLGILFPERDKNEIAEPDPQQVLKKLSEVRRILDEIFPANSID